MLAPRISATDSGLWPTPVASDTGQRKAPYAQGGTPLSLAAANWPTPTSSLGSKASQETHDRNSRPLSEQVGGLLNADWVELLMGWPKGWTDLKPLESADMRGWGDGWEDGTPRVLVGAKHRTHRLKAIGNGQVPLCAATAWRLLEGVAA